MHRANPTFIESMSICWPDAMSKVGASEYPARVRLFQQGSRPDCAYFVASGLVKLACLNAEGKEVIVGLRGPGTLLGATALVLNQPHLTTGVTLTPCHLARVSASEFGRLLEGNAQLSQYLHKLHAREVNAQLELLVDAVSRPAQYRLRKLLCNVLSAVRSTLRSATDPNLWLPLKQWEIAELLSVTPEHTNRLLRRLEEDGLVRRRGRLLSVPDPERLFAVLDA